MSIQDLLIPILTFVSGGGLISLLTMKANKRLKGAEADGAAVKALDEAFALVSKLEQENQNLRAVISERDEEILRLKNENTTKGQYICTHLGCACRRPAVGLGKVYFEKHKDEEDFGADYTTIEDLIAKYKRKRYDWGQKPPKSLEEAKEEYLSEKDNM